MARIQMQTAKNMTMEDCFKLFLSVTAAKGVKDKTLETYRNHFKSISKRLNVTSFIHLLTRKQLDEMILLMRSEHLSDRSINSYTRTLRVFLTWCNGEGYTSVTIPVFKASESVKETYTDEELALLLEKPKANCNFCEYRNWAIVNFLINSGCRAATVRNIQIKDVDLPHRQIMLRHTKNGKVQIIPLCSAMTSILRDYMAIRGGLLNVTLLSHHPSNKIDLLDVAVDRATLSGYTALILQIFNERRRTQNIIRIGITQKTLKHYVWLQLLIWLFAVTSFRFTHFVAFFLV